MGLGLLSCLAVPAWLFAQVTKGSVGATGPLPVVQSSQQGPWPVTSHQGSEWNLNIIAHVQAVMAHVQGTVTTEGRGSAGSAVGGIVTVQGPGVGNALGQVQQGPAGAARWPMDAHLATVAATAGALTVNQGNTWTIQAAHQGGTSWTSSQGPAGNFKWPVDAHIATGAVSQGTAGNFAWPVSAHLASIGGVVCSSLDACGKQGSAGAEVWPVRAHQGSEWNINQVLHVQAAMVHVQSTVTIEGRGSAGTATGGVVTVQGIASGTPMRVSLLNGVSGQLPCHSQVTFSKNASSIIVFGQNTLRIYICSVIVGLSTLGAGNTNFSLVEGTAANCGTGTAALIGGTTGNGGLILTHAAASYQYIAPFPWLSTQTAGDPICLLLGTSLPTVVGTIVYGAY